MAEEDIMTKLPEEPVQKTGFKFGAVMGKRLVDYGIMSSSSGSEEEDVALKPKGEFRQVELTRVERRSMSQRVATHDSEEENGNLQTEIP